MIYVPWYHQLKLLPLVCKHLKRSRYTKKNDEDEDNNDNDDYHDYSHTHTQIAKICMCLVPRYYFPPNPIIFI